MTKKESEGFHEKAQKIIDEACSQWTYCHIKGSDIPDINRQAVEKIREFEWSGFTFMGEPVFAGGVYVQEVKYLQP